MAEKLLDCYKRPVSRYRNRAEFVELLEIGVDKYQVRMSDYNSMSEMWSYYVPGLQLARRYFENYRPG